MRACRGDTIKAKRKIVLTADLALYEGVPGHYKRPDEFVECAPLGYALLFSGGDDLSNSGSSKREQKCESAARPRSQGVSVIE